MKALTRTFNFASPWGWALAGLALLAFAWLCVVALGGVGFHFDPFNSTEKRADRAEQQAAKATADAGARAQEVAGARETVVKVEATLRQQHQAAAIAADFANQAREAPDANQPLDPDRVSRLVAADQRLCALDPAVCNPSPSATRHAGDG
ncbi:hypothetical protein GCM10017620_25930 [Brevundimonas intermedia]|uniref:Uncharacterized protein n=1 Tax=Brevundimonas intermedia TaxID=74315 RepID=A0ABQ5TBW0_9CAUL|nr:hypothetical protein [Brevundimonas intermedia]GLK49620.1 hypothetical protein GCM10017620_25930 [Brevundimonas intermedia]